MSRTIVSAAPEARWKRREGRGMRLVVVRAAGLWCVVSAASWSNVGVDS